MSPPCISADFKETEGCERCEIKPRVEKVHFFLPEILAKGKWKKARSSRNQVKLRVKRRRAEKNSLVNHVQPLFSETGSHVLKVPYFDDLDRAPLCVYSHESAVERKQQFPLRSDWFEVSQADSVLNKKCCGR